MNREETKQHIAVEQAFVDGTMIEYSTHGYEEWTTCKKPDWYWHLGVYRVKVTLPSINWDHVANKYKWLAKDSNLKCCLFEEKPCPDEYVWEDPAKSSLYADGFTSLDIGTCGWKDSLVERPK